MNTPVSARNRLDVLFAPVLLLACPTALADLPRGPNAFMTVDCYWIEEATILNDRQEEGEYGLANVGHQITRGRNVVLSIREYNDDDRGPDSQDFKKLTLEFKASPTTRKPGSQHYVRVDRSYFTGGSSAFGYKGWYGWVSGPVTSFSLLHDKRGAHAHINAVFDIKTALSGEVKRQRVAWKCPVTKLTVSQLNAWQGKPGTIDQSFYRPDN